MKGAIALRLAELAKELDPKILAQVGYKTFRKETPIRTGNARSHTALIQDEIVAEYPYAQRLDTGWSKQSPQGMTKPTIAAVEDYIKKVNKG